MTRVSNLVVLAIATIGAAFAVLAVLSASKHVRIAFVNAGPAVAIARNVEAFRDGLRELGYTEGRNLTIDFRWADGDVRRLPALVAELLNLKPDVIVSSGGEATARAVEAATQTIPVVLITGDPVYEGLVASLARPGANVTGFGVMPAPLEGKRLELLKDLLPGAMRVGIVWNPSKRTSIADKSELESAAQRLGIEIAMWEARDATELDRALAGVASSKVDAFIVMADPVLGFERERIVVFANQMGIPAIYFWREFVEIGGLISYGTNLSAVFRRAASYVDKILKGAAPGDLPIELPTTFELVINQRTARSLGLTVPQAMLLRATDVIQ